MSDTSEDEDLGRRWEQFKSKSWSKNDYTNKFENEDGVEIDWTRDPKARDEYFDQVETDYTYFCYDQKDYEACQKRADFMATFRNDVMEGYAEYMRCCDTYKTPGCCFNASKYMYFHQLEKDRLQTIDVEKYWSMVTTSCLAGEYPRSKQQQEHRTSACIQIFKARQNVAINDQDVHNPVEKNLPQFVHDVNLFRQLNLACFADNVLGNWESCSILSAAMMNPKISEFTNIPINPKLAIEYAVRACNGGGDGLGYVKSCINLANLYERGNRQLGIEANKELHEYYKLKEFYHTPEGMINIAVSVPAAGSVI